MPIKPYLIRVLSAPGNQSRRGVPIASRKLTRGDSQLWEEEPRIFDIESICSVAGLLF